MIAFLDLRSNLSFIDFFAPSSKFFFAVAGLSSCHGLVSSFSIALLFYPEQWSGRSIKQRGGANWKWLSFLRQSNLQIIALYLECQLIICAVVPTQGLAI
jgi:hypothetical protein